MIGPGRFLRLTSHDLPRSAKLDPFGPFGLRGAVLLRCTHCGARVKARELVWSERSETWDCPQPGCNGSGIGYDLFEVGRYDQRRK